jgi:hypothetical protein
MNYWVKQTKDQPLFEDILWSRPQNKRSAGKLLIIGGQQHSFADTVKAYHQALQAGVGAVRVLLPDSLQKTVGGHLENVWFAPSNKSGGFGKESLAGWLEHSEWADAVLISHDIGKNSETAVLLELYIQKYSGSLTLVGESAELIGPRLLIKSPSILIVMELKNLQKFAVGAHSMHPIYRGMQLSQLVETLHKITLVWQLNILTRHENTAVVASRGNVSTTQLEVANDVNDLASPACVFWLQNPDKPFESITASLIF